MSSFDIHSRCNRIFIIIRIIGFIVIIILIYTATTTISDAKKLSSTSFSHTVNNHRTILLPLTTTTKNDNKSMRRGVIKIPTRIKTSSSSLTKHKKIIEIMSPFIFQIPVSLLLSSTSIVSSSHRWISHPKMIMKGVCTTSDVTTTITINNNNNCINNRMNGGYRSSRRHKMMNDLYSIIPILRGGDGSSGSSEILMDYIDNNNIIIDYTQFVDGAYNWCINLGAPSALVAGAVVASIYENMNNNNCNYQIGDNKITLYKKLIVRWLLITSFALEALSIFVTTITGTMLLSQEIDILIPFNIIRTAKTPLQLLQHHFELQYLAGYISFLQGILHWFLAISINHTIPIIGEKYPSSMNIFLSSVLLSTILFMLSTYNKHLYFYSNYGIMLIRFIQLMIQEFTSWPPKRPISILLVPSMIFSCCMGIKVFIFTDYHNINNNDHVNSSLQSSSSFSSVITTDTTNKHEKKGQRKSKPEKQK